MSIETSSPWRPQSSSFANSTTMRSFAETFLVAGCYERLPKCTIVDWVPRSNGSIVAERTRSSVESLPSWLVDRYGCRRLQDESVIGNRFEQDQDLIRSP